MQCSARRLRARRSPRAPWAARRRRRAARPPSAGTRSSTRSQLRVEGQGERPQLARGRPRRRSSRRSVRSRAGSARRSSRVRGPAPVERDAGGDLVEHLEPRRELGLDGVLGEDALGEGVEGADGGAVELGERRPGTARRSSAGGVPAVGALLELLAHAVAQLGRRPSR